MNVVIVKLCHTLPNLGGCMYLKKNKLSIQNILRKFILKNHFVKIV